MCNEADIIKGLVNKEQEVFKAFVEAWQKKIINLCFSFVNNAEDAQDVAQEVFIEVYKSINKFRGDSKLSTWLYRIAVNRSLNFLKQKKRNKIFSFSFLWEEQEKSIENSNKHDYYYNSDKSIEENENREVLFKAILSLPEKQRIAFSLHNLNNLPYKNIAEIMKISLSAVESLIFRAKANLRKKLYSFFADE